MNAAGRNIIRFGLTLGFATLGACALLVLTHGILQGKIESQQRKAVLVSLNQVLAGTVYDNRLQDDYIDLDAQAFFQHPTPVRIYRARMDGANQAIVMRVTTSEGYNGDITLLAGIDSKGRVLGVRVLRHRETPGLGGAALQPEGNAWMRNFTGKSLGSPVKEQWDVISHGGVFDQFTGATITPRAVIHAVRRSLEYFAANRTRLFSAPAAIRKS